jgi:hypothetical protein
MLGSTLKMTWAGKGASYREQTLHIYMFIRIQLKILVTEVMGDLKGKSSRMCYWVQ